MNIVMHINYSHPSGEYKQNQVVEVSDEIGAKFVEQGLASVAKEPVKKTEKK